MPIELFGCGQRPQPNVVVPFLVVDFDGTISRTSKSHDRYQTLPRISVSVAALGRNQGLMSSTAGDDDLVSRLEHSKQVDNK